MERVSESPESPAAPEAGRPDPGPGAPLRDGDVLGPLAVAGGVFAALVAQFVLLGFVATLTNVGIGPVDPTAIGYVWAGQAQGIAFTALPLAAGVFLSFWLLAPITADLGLGALALRSVLATAVGALLVIAVVVLVAFASSIGGVRFFGDSFPDLGYAARSAWFAVVAGVGGALRAVVIDLPIVVLAAALLRMRRQRRPRSEPRDAAVGEV